MFLMNELDLKISKIVIFSNKYNLLEILFTFENLK